MSCPIPSEDQVERAKGIIHVIAHSCNTTYENIMSESRNRLTCAYPRMLSYLFVRTFVPDMTYANLTWFFERDHSTMIYGVFKIIDMLDARDMVMTEMYNSCRINLTRGNPDRITMLQNEMDRLIRNRRRHERNSFAKSKKYSA